VQLGGRRSTPHVATSLPPMSIVTSRIVRRWARRKAAAGGARADVAQVERHFSSTAFTPTLPFPQHGDVPLNVIRICQWTTMCSNLDFHPNPRGYAVLADAVVDRLRR
jgi:hypothetical protein